MVLRLLKTISQMLFRKLNRPFQPSVPYIRSHGRRCSSGYLEDDCSVAMNNSGHRGGKRRCCILGIMALECTWVVWALWRNSDYRKKGASNTYACWRVLVAIVATKSWPIHSVWDISHTLWMGHLDLAVRLRFYLWILSVNLTTYSWYRPFPSTANQCLYVDYVWSFNRHRC